MTDPADPLAKLWAADAPPARDPAFTASVIARAGHGRNRGQALLLLLRGLGLGAGAFGGALLLVSAGMDGTTLAILAVAIAGAVWTGRRPFTGA